MVANRRSRQRRPRLPELLRYRNADVLDRFCDTWFVTRAQAREVFADLLRYLWVANELAIDEGRAIPPVAIIDEMWHAFLAFTKDYARWSQRYFGRMLHHQPLTNREKRANLRRFRSKRALAEIAKRYESDLGAIYDRLGKSAVLRWYVRYERQYPPRFFNTRRRPMFDDVTPVSFPRRLSGR